MESTFINQDKLELVLSKLGDLALAYFEKLHRKQTAELVEGLADSSKYINKAIRVANEKFVVGMSKIDTKIAELRK